MPWSAAQASQPRQNAWTAGGSPWAEYWRRTVAELREGLVASGHLDDAAVDAFLARCADPEWWTQTIAFTAVWGRRAEYAGWALLGSNQ